MRNKIITILSVAAVIVAVILYYEWKITKMDTSYKAIITEKDQKLSYTTNEFGHMVAEKNAAVASRDQIAAAYPEIVKELKEEFDVKLKDMEVYIKNEFKAQGSGKGTVIHNHYTDSSGTTVPYWEVKAFDGYLDFSGKVFDSLSMDYKYTYTDTITTVISSRKKWFLGKETMYATSMLRNKNAKVTGATNVLVDRKDKRFVIYVGVGYDPFSNQPVINVGGGFALLKF